MSIVLANFLSGVYGEIRTRISQNHNLVLYQLSYVYHVEPSVRFELTCPIWNWVTNPVQSTTMRRRHFLHNRILTYSGNQSTIKDIEIIRRKSRSCRIRTHILGSGIRDVTITLMTYGALAGFSPVSFIFLTRLKYKCVNITPSSAFYLAVLVGFEPTQFFEKTFFQISSNRLFERQIFRTI